MVDLSIWFCIFLLINQTQRLPRLTLEFMNCLKNYCKVHLCYEFSVVTTLVDELPERQKQQFQACSFNPLF